MHRLLQRPFPYARLRFQPSFTGQITHQHHQVAALVQVAACAFARLYSVERPSRTVDGFLRFPVNQPPSRLTLLFPFSQTDVRVITGGYETVQVKVAEGASLAAGGFEVEYDGSHVALIEQQATEKDAQQTQPSSRSILAKVPERYCHVGLHTAGGTVDVESVTEASLRVVTCSGALKLGKIKASSVDVDTAGGSLQCQVMTADRADIKTGGGSIDIGRLVGQHCTLNAQPQPSSKTSSHGSNQELGSSKVQVDVAYTESLQVKTGRSSITFAFLDTMNGSASLTTQGGDIAVDGLDGTASLQSNGGNLQVKLQENARQVEAHSGGGTISCRVPPSFGACPAVLEPRSCVKLGDGVQFEEPVSGEYGILCVGDRPSSSQRVARQQPTTGRQGTEQQQQQSALSVENMASQPVVKLLLDARETANDAALFKGQISIATESWLDRAAAKAKASMHKKNKDESALH